MTASTPLGHSPSTAETLVWQSLDATEEVPHTAASTASSRNTLSRFGSFAAPIVAAASLLSAGPPAVVRRFYSVAESSSSGIRDLRWDWDDIWVPTNARTTQDEIDALNALLSLTLAEGCSVDTVDDF